MVANFIIILVVIIGFVFMFIKVFKEEEKNKIIYDIACDTLDDYLSKLQNTYDTEELNKIYNTLLNDSRIFIIKNEDELHFIIRGLRDKLDYINTVYHVKLNTLSFLNR